MTTCNHIHDQSQHARRIGPTIHQIAQKDRLASIRMPDLLMPIRLLTRLDVIAKLLQQRTQLIVAAMYIADDVEGTMFVLEIAPQRLTLDFGLLDLLWSREKVCGMETLAA